MTAATSSSPGRPRAASRELLAEAAVELFQRDGFEATTIAQISQLAGVSRNTFFNYFASKADVLWFDFDPLLAGIGSQLAATSGTLSALEAIAAVLQGFAREVDARSGDLVVGKTVFAAGARGDSSAFDTRMSTLAGVVAEYAAVRLNDDPDALQPQLLGALAATVLRVSLTSWARDVQPGSGLSTHVAEGMGAVTRMLVLPR
ncbi:MAG TPA: TetR family transcriptional regulator [Pseudoclavibacter sp.]|nr:TetR family transcriptional regulator [Pseudoclavibacter sp.]